jgi:copper chaperone CopZ
MSPTDSSQPESTSGQNGTTSVAQLTVEGMHCGSCVAIIEATLTEQPGLRDARVDLESARAVVEYDPSRLSLEEIRSAIAKAGYSATLVV